MKDSKYTETNAIGKQTRTQTEHQPQLWIFLWHFYKFRIIMVSDIQDTQNKENLNKLDELLELITED